MEFTRLSSPSLKEMFVSQIEKLILSGELSVGDKLPVERELSRQMGISRTVVNAGLSELEKKGFIEMRPRIGAFIADYKRKGTVDTLLAIISFNGSMKKEQIKSLLEFRMVVESLALELMIPRMNAADSATLHSLADRFYQAESANELAEAVFALHHEICVLSGNFLLPVVFYSFKEMATWLWRKYFTRHGSAALFENTSRLLRSIDHGDEKAAVDVFRDSLKKTIDGILSIYND